MKINIKIVTIGLLFVNIFSALLIIFFILKGV
jgi:hypothetical protein